MGKRRSRDNVRHKWSKVYNLGYQVYPVGSDFNGHDGRKSNGDPYNTRYVDLRDPYSLTLTKSELKQLKRLNIRYLLKGRETVQLISNSSKSRSFLNYIINAVSPTYGYKPSTILATSSAIILLYYKPLRIIPRRISYDEIRSIELYFYLNPVRRLIRYLNDRAIVAFFLTLFVEIFSVGKRHYHPGGFYQTKETIIISNNSGWTSIIQGIDPQKAKEIKQIVLDHNTLSTPFPETVDKERTENLDLSGTLRIIGNKNAQKRVIKETKGMKGIDFLFSVDKLAVDDPDLIIAVSGLDEKMINGLAGYINSIKGVKRVTYDVGESLLHKSQ